MENQKVNYEIKNNSGSIFRNESATGNQPTYRGKVKVNNVEMDISLWVKDTKTGCKFFSASFQEPFVKPTTTEPNVKINNIENDLPF
jgi:uncharacterized protein (DUF736 family)